MAPGVHVGDAYDLSNIAIRSQNEIIMDNPFGYDPFHKELLRVLSAEGTITIRGGKNNGYVSNIEAIAD